MFLSCKQGNKEKYEYIYVLLLEYKLSLRTILFCSYEKNFFFYFKPLDYLDILTT